MATKSLLVPRNLFIIGLLILVPVTFIPAEFLIMGRMLTLLALAIFVYAIIIRYKADDSLPKKQRKNSKKRTNNTRTQKPATVTSKTSSPVEKEHQDISTVEEDVLDTAVPIIENSSKDNNPDSSSDSHDNDEISERMDALFVDIEDFLIKRSAIIKPETKDD